MENSVVVIVPDGVGVKNYIYSNAIKSNNYDVTILHSFDKKSVNELKKDYNYSFIKLIDYKETLLEKFYREAIHLSRLIYNSKLENNETIKVNFKSKGKGLAGILFYKLIILFAKKQNSYQKILKLEQKYQLALRKSEVYRFYLKEFKEKNPKKIFCTHQRAVIAPPIFAAAKDVGIQTTTAIYSWDNLPKARLALRADEYIVWSPQMARDIKAFYKEIKDSQIKILGTPQFQFHKDKNYLWPKDKFAEIYDLDINKKWLCFSGDDKTTSPYDPKYLKDIAEELSSSALKSEWQILLRPVPVEGFEKYQDVIDQFPQLIKKAGAFWNINPKWSNSFPKLDDLKALNSICHYSQAVINVGSTMALDFGMHGRPAIYINYDHYRDSNWSVQRIYKFQHFRTMKGLTPVIWLNSKDDIIQILNNLQSLKAKIITDMERWSEIIIPVHLRKTSSSLINQNLQE